MAPTAAYLSIPLFARGRRAPPGPGAVAARRAPGSNGHGATERAPPPTVAEAVEALDLAALVDALHHDHTTGLAPPAAGVQQQSRSEALCAAAKAGATRLCKLLFVAGAAVNHRDRFDWTALQRAACAGHAGVAAACLAQPGVQPDLADADGITALFLASQKGHVAVVEMLLAWTAGASGGAGAAAVDVNRADAEGATPLGIAAEHGQARAVQMLLAHGAAVNQARAKGETPLYQACRKGRADVVRLLLADGSGALAVNQATAKVGATPLCVAAQKGAADVVALLLGDARTEVNAASRNGATPLVAAAQKGYVAVVELLLDAGADPARATKNGTTAHACARKHGALFPPVLLQRLEGRPPASA